MILELLNLEVPAECCTLDTSTGKTTFYKGEIKVPGFTGFYFRNDTSFLGIYPTNEGPKIYLNNKQFDVNPGLDISLVINGRNRKFIIKDYNIEVDYLESPYIGMDCWSDEIDVDLFFMIEQSYKSQSFYDKFTV